ncbi:hypothetical protein LLG95_00045 [bacterium]|nr:hypothetical protein [bacterium]
MAAKVNLGAIQEFCELLKRLTGWKIQIKSRASHQTDYVMDITLDDHLHPFLMEFKQQLVTSMIPRLIQQIKRFEHDAHLPALLAVPYIAPAQADTLRKAGVSYVDLKGNLHIDVPGMKIWFVEAARRLRDRPQVHTVTRQNMTSSGVRLVYILLNSSQLITTNYRDLANRSGISVGSVKATLDWLKKKDFLRTFGSGHANRILVKKKELLDLWIEAFSERLKPKLLIGRYETVGVGERIPGKPSIIVRGYSFHPDEASWGGEMAAIALANEQHYNPGRGKHVYIRRKNDLNALLTRHKLSRDSNGGLELFEAFWRPIDEVKAGNAPPLVVYAELMNSGSSRCWNIAGKIYDLFLKERIEDDSRA